MTNSLLTEIIAVVDRTGSMKSCSEFAIESFNSFLHAQKECPGEANFTLVLFDSGFEDSFLVLFDGANIRNVKPLDRESYIPRGMTPLYDAVGKAMEIVGARLADTCEADRPGKVIFMILTDGYENDSETFTVDRVKEMIEHQQKVYSWEFIFLGAAIDAYEIGSSIGIAQDHCLRHEKDEEAYKEAMNHVSGKVLECRADFGRSFSFEDAQPKAEPPEKRSRRKSKAKS